MTKKEALQLFEEKKIRSVWDDKEEKWYFSIVDVCAVLTESKDPTAVPSYTVRSFSQSGAFQTVDGTSGEHTIGADARPGEKHRPGCDGL